MKLFFLGVIATAFAGAAFIACGGDDAVSSGGDAGSDATTQDGSAIDAASDVASDDGGVGGDGASSDAASDAFSDASDGGADGSATSGRGKVACGSTPCVLDGGHACCDTIAADASTHQCGSLAQGSFCVAGATQECDEKADCTTGVCCIQFLQNGIQARCMGTCVTGAQRYQACSTSAECENQGVCTVYAGCTAGETVRTCEQPQECP